MLGSDSEYKFRSVKLDSPPTPKYILIDFKKKGKRDREISMIAEDR